MGTEITDNIKRSSSMPEDAAKEMKIFAEREVEYHQHVMSVNDDWKNYNGWSHRHFIVAKFGLWENEMKFIEDMLRDDIRNNSAWNHRHTVVRNTTWPPMAEIREREINFTLT